MKPITTILVLCVLLHCGLHWWASHRTGAPWRGVEASTLAVKTHKTVCKTKVHVFVQDTPCETTTCTEFIQPFEHRWLIHNKLLRSPDCSFLSQLTFSREHPSVSRQRAQTIHGNRMCNRKCSLQHTPFLPVTSSQAGWLLSNLMCSRSARMC